MDRDVNEVTISPRVQAVIDAIDQIGWEVTPIPNVPAPTLPVVTPMIGFHTIELTRALQNMEFKLADNYVGMAMARGLTARDIAIGVMNRIIQIDNNWLQYVDPSLRWTSLTFTSPPAMTEEESEATQSAAFATVSADPNAAGPPAMSVTGYAFAGAAFAIGYGAPSSGPTVTINGITISNYSGQPAFSAPYGVITMTPRDDANGPAGNGVAPTAGTAGPGGPESP